jgi:hypothetical protein
MLDFLSCSHMRLISIIHSLGHSHRKVSEMHDVKCTDWQSLTPITQH